MINARRQLAIYRKALREQNEITNNVSGALRELRFAVLEQHDRDRETKNRVVTALIKIAGVS